MRWWPVAAAVSASIFVISLGFFAFAPSIVALCGQVGEASTCEPLVTGSRALVVGSGAFLTASLVAGLYTALLAHKMVNASDKDTRPLVSVHARRRH